VTDSPLVSVLTPSLNQARWLGHNLDSVAVQSYPRVEQIVMDGGSTDGSLDILARARHNVRWSSEPDKGQSHALNKALGKSRGEIIGWINSDDAYFNAGAVAYAVELFGKHPAVDVIYGHTALVNRDGLVLQAIWAPPFSRRLLRFHNFITQPSVFIRRSALRHRFLNEEYHSYMDKELWLRLAATGHRFLRANRVLAIDRHYPERKGIARVDLVAADALKLQVSYRLRIGAWHRWLVKPLKVGFRFPGAGIAARIHGGPLAFNGGWDDKWRLLRRQVGARRSRMPGCAPLEVH
jgi:glycosyltransferase involved in cell wall biosynthesis